MRNTPYWKAMFSPFRRLTLKVYAGRLAVGMPYFYPRKLVYVSEAEAIEIANEQCDKYDAKDIGYDYADELQKARSWLYYNYNTDVTKTPKERIAETRKERTGMVTSYQKGKDPVTSCIWDSILKSRYL